VKKIFALLFVMSGMSLSVAEEGGPKGKNFEEAKAHALKMVDARSKALQEAKTCISAAKAHDDLKKCHESMKEHRKEFKEARQEFREERKGKREEWKNKRKESRGKDAPPPPPEGDEE